MKHKAEARMRVHKHRKKSGVNSTPKYIVSVFKSKIDPKTFISLRLSFVFSMYDRKVMNSVLSALLWSRRIMAGQKAVIHLQREHVYQKKSWKHFYITWMMRYEV